MGNVEKPETLFLSQQRSGVEWWECGIGSIIATPGMAEIEVCTPHFQASIRTGPEATPRVRTLENLITVLTLSYIVRLQLDEARRWDRGKSIETLRYLNDVQIGEGRREGRYPNNI